MCIYPLSAEILDLLLGYLLVDNTFPLNNVMRMDFTYLNVYVCSVYICVRQCWTTHVRVEVRG